jgi:hypothetical protein
MASRPAALPDEGLLGVKKQRKSPGRLENPLAPDGGSDPDTDHGLSLSSGNQQVEQDRAPALFVYQFEPERAAVDQL